jgi:putative Holliday junction resolvase
MKYLCLDYGSKKIGVSISDDMGMLAFPLKIILNKDKEKSLSEILEIIKENNIKEIVIGESLNQSGIPNNILEEAKLFAKKISEITDLKINFEKEWFSTLEARRYNDRHDADDSAAAIILQRFLDKVNKK